jgi:hypothetical protein
MKQVKLSQVVSALAAAAATGVIFTSVLALADAPPSAIAGGQWSKAVPHRNAARLVLAAAPVAALTR